MTKQTHLLILKIEQGIVIDHIPAGKGPELLDIIRSYPEMKNAVSSLGLNYKSTKFGSKDLIKIQVEDFPERIVQHISLIAPGVTMKRIRDFEVDKRYVNQPPEVIDNLVKCLNPECITNFERDVRTRFCRVSDQGLRFRCSYCERIFSVDELELLMP